jgi:hypothetical protein
MGRPRRHRWPRVQVHRVTVRDAEFACWDINRRTANLPPGSAVRLVVGDVFPPADLMTRPRIGIRADLDYEVDTDNQLALLAWNRAFKEATNV